MASARSSSDGDDDDVVVRFIRDNPSVGTDRFYRFLYFISFIIINSIFNYFYLFNVIITWFICILIVSYFILMLLIHS